MSKTVFLSYAYYETQTSKTHLEFFLKHGITSNMTVFINIKDKCTVDTTIFENVFVFYAEENVGYDFRSHKENLTELKRRNGFVYDFYIMMNDGCLGPFYNGGGNWHDTFTDKLNKKIKLVGTNYVRIQGPMGKYSGKFPYNHKRQWSVGGWFFCTDVIGINILYGLYNLHDIENYGDAHALENMNGRWMKKNGYGVDGILKGLKNGKVIDPYKVVIFKVKYNPTCFHTSAVQNLLRSDEPESL